MEFLSDVIPRTTTYKEYKAQRAVRTAKSQASRAVSGNADSGVGSAQQMTLDGKTGVPIRPAVAATAVPPPAGGVSEETMEREEGLELVQNGEINNVGRKQREDVRDEDDTPIDVPAPEGPHDGLVFEHYKPNGEGASSGSRVQAGEEEEDVEMG